MLVDILSFIVCNGTMMYTVRIPAFAVLLFLLLQIGSEVAASPAITTSSVTATGSSSYFGSVTAPSLTCDGSGLTGDLCDNSSSGVGMWLSVSGGGGSASNNPAGIAGPAWLRYHFDRDYFLSEAWVWNQNQLNLTDRGLRNVSIHYSADGVQWTLLTTCTLTRAPGAAGYAHGDTISFGGVRARDVLITAASTNGNYGSTYYGLSEIRFYGDPAGASSAVTLQSVTTDDNFNQMLAPQATGWLGSDVAHSIPLPNGKVLWLFGDTFIGTVSGGARQAGATFIHNSIGIQDTTLTPPLGMIFYWGAGNTAFFPHANGTPGAYYWPTSGIYLGGKLFIFCYSVQLDGNIAHTTLITISNPTDPPGLWVKTYADFGLGDNNIGFHTAVYAEDGYVYYMGAQSAGFTKNMVLARSTAAALQAGGHSEILEYWTNPGTGPAWTTTSSSLVTLFTPGNTESDIQYDPTLGLYFATTYDVWNPPIYITTAPSLTGPWSTPTAIYSVPEYSMVSFSIISYAARPHPEFSTQPGELLISYETNALGASDPLFTQEGLAIYHPRFIRARFTSSTSGVAEWSLY